MEKNVLFTNPLPSNEHLDNFVELMNHTGLGPDPSSDFFINRKKSIAYVVNFGQKWVKLDYDCINQPSDYNDLSGGFSRKYKVISKEMLQHDFMLQVLNHYKRVHKVEEGKVILIQLHTSVLHDPADYANMNINEDDSTIKRKRKNSIVGQGIHTDGNDRGMVMALERINVDGATNCFHSTLTCGPDAGEKILQPGQAAHWKDNSVYHSVSAAGPVSFNEKSVRSVLLMHYPAEFGIVGRRNQNNNLGVNETSGRQLRGIDEYAGKVWRVED